MSVATVLKLAAWGVIVAVVLQIIFCFFFQIIGYDPYLLSISLIMSVIAVLLLLAGWMSLKKQLDN
jgi:high-affinity Fe2+/Pb2+ permease